MFYKKEADWKNYLLIQKISNTGHFLWKKKDLPQDRTKEEND